MADVFISYSSQDRDRVRPIAEALIKRGLSVWWDRALAAGDDYTRVIERELAAAKAVIVVWTETSVQSAFVRDEAGRARDDGRLLPILLDRNAQIPLGFGAFQAEDFTAWNGSPQAAQIALLEEAVRAKVEGRGVDGATIQAKRKRLMQRIRVVSILGVTATVLGIAASVYTLTRPRIEQVAVQQQDQFAQLLQLVADGKITGDQALELAKLMETQAFATPAPGGAETKSVSLSGPRSFAPESGEEIVFVSQTDMQQEARGVFREASTTLLQDPDPRVRQAMLALWQPATREQGLNQLWDLAKEGGALMLATGDARAVKGLENAAKANPQDKAVWRMLSYGLGQAGNARNAASATLVSEGLTAIGASDWGVAMQKLGAALPLTENPESRSFILGQLGDVAVEAGDWKNAIKHYRNAVEMDAGRNDMALAGLNAQKLARALQKDGNPRLACQTLRRAKSAGANVNEQEMTEACDAPAQRPGALNAARTSPLVQPH
jgi:tetratricopeptide (TPR) repeat protein